MALKDITRQEATIKFPGGEFVVGGLSLPAVTWLVRRHSSAFESIFEAVQSGDTDPSNFTGLADALITQFPALAADVIAAGAGEPDMTEAAAGLPFSVQLEALEKIGEITFSVEGGVKKVVETVIRVAQGSTSLMKALSA